MPPGGKGSPPWAIAKLFPNQGHWSEGEYLELSERTNRLIEMIDGCVEVLDMPSKTHQLIIQFMYRAMFAFVTPNQLGQVMLAAYPLKLWEGRFREPDVLFALAAHTSWFGEKFATGADLVIEVVSEDRRRDLETKRGEYEQAGIPEYWIVDPRDQRITVLQLVNGAYIVAGEYSLEGQAKSVILPGFSVDVAMIFMDAG
jgi:Uma2 family endonuclease